MESRTQFRVHAALAKLKVSPTEQEEMTRMWEEERPLTHPTPKIISLPGPEECRPYCVKDHRQQHWHQSEETVPSSGEPQLLQLQCDLNRKVPSNDVRLRLSADSSCVAGMFGRDNQSMCVAMPMSVSSQPLPWVNSVWMKGEAFNRQSCSLHVYKSITSSCLHWVTSRL